MKKGFFFVILSIILFPASLWGLAWFLTMASFSSEHCMGQFSIFHEELVCRKPYLGLYLAVFSGLFSFYLLFSGVKSIKKANEEESLKSE